MSLLLLLKANLEVYVTRRRKRDRRASSPRHTMEAVDNADRSKYPQLFTMLLTSECRGFTRERASGDLSHSILAPGQRSDIDSAAKEHV
jgi:hypothetical protein